MTVNLIRSDSLYTGVPYAYASIAAPGALIFTAGACPLDDNGKVVGAGDVRAQASLAVANLVAAWEVVEAAFGEHDAPSTLLGVTVLGYTDQLVEIEAVAVAPS